MVSKKLLPGNSVVEVIFWNSKLIFTEKILMFIRQNTIPNDHMEFCLVLNLTMCGDLAVTWLPKLTTRYVSFATALNTR